MSPRPTKILQSADGPIDARRTTHYDPVEIKRLLDAGFYNFLVPMVESAGAARAAVAATRYPPQGIPGVSVAQRRNRYGTGTPRMPCRTGAGRGTLG